MKALDTNVLVRFLVRDDTRQADIVYRVFKEAEESKDVLFVPLLVVLEVFWVLESVYEIPRIDILDAIHELLLMPILKFEAQSAISNAISQARKTRMDLSDLLIAHSARSSGCEYVLTFDRRASNSELFEKLR